MKDGLESLGQSFFKSDLTSLPGFAKWSYNQQSQWTSKSTAVNLVPLNFGIIFAS